MEFLKNYCSFFKNLHKRYKILGLSFLLVVLGFAILGFPYYNTGLLNDDLVWCWICRFKDWSWRKIFFSSCSVFNISDLNSINMFTACHRPFSELMVRLVYWLWEGNGYAYLLFNVFLHSLNSILVFNIFSWFLEIKYAFLGALIFLSHGAIGKWLLLMCANPDLINLTFLLLVIIFFKKFLDSRFYRYYFFSNIFFLLALLTKEPLAIFPLVLLIFRSILYYFEYGLSLKALVDSFKKVCLFFVTLIFWLGMRFILFGFSLNSERLFLGVSARNIKEYIWNIFEFLKDVTGFTFLTIPDPRSKLLVFLPFFLLLLFLFIKNTKRRYLFFLCIATLLFSWPCLVITHHSRYAFPGIPFFILFLLFSFRFSEINFEKGIKRILCYCFFGGIVVWGFIDGSSRLLTNEKLTHASDLALKEFARKLKSGFYKDEKLLFLGMPHWLYFTGLAEGICYFSSDENLKIYHERGGDFILRDYNNPLPFESINNGFSINKIKNGYRLVSNDEKLFVYAPPNNGCDVYPTGAVTKIVNARYDKWRAKDVSLIFDKKYFTSNGKINFFSWNWKKEKVYLLENCFISL